MTEDLLYSFIDLHSLYHLPQESQLITFSGNALTQSFGNPISCLVQAALMTDISKKGQSKSKKSVL